MKHLGDITKLHGWEIEPVDIIVGGSPCQDLSVAGLKKGLAGERSGLFHEQIRIIREMREYERDVRKRPADLIRPRFCIWENVMGAYGSGKYEYSDEMGRRKVFKGEDFRIVLESFAKIADPTVSIPRPESGKWEHSGCIVGDGWSIAWTAHNAADWCVPQRRQRVSVVADFGSEYAGELLFTEILAKREGLPGNSEQSRAAGEDAAGEVEDGTGEAVGTAPGTYAEPDTRRVRGDDELHPENSGGCDRDANGKAAGKGPLIQCEMSATLGASQDQTLFVFEGNGQRESHKGDGWDQSETMYTLNTIERHAVCYNISPYSSNSMLSDNPMSGIQEIDTSRTLDLLGGNPSCNQGGTMVVEEPVAFGAYNQAATGAVTKALNSAATDSDHVPIVVYQERTQPVLIEMTSTKNTVVEDGICPTLTARMGTGGNQVNAVLDDGLRD